LTSAANHDFAALDAELMVFQEIYRSAGFKSLRLGYSIGKVIEMLRSDHMRNLPTETRRASMLMALEAAGVLLGQARKPEQPLYFSVPAPALGVSDDNFTFHETTLGKSLRELGYEPNSLSEGSAIVYGELADSNSSGIGSSDGGMCKCLSGLD